MKIALAIITFCYFLANRACTLFLLIILLCTTSYFTTHIKMALTLTTAGYIKVLFIIQSKCPHSSYTYIAGARYIDNFWCTR